MSTIHYPDDFDVDYHAELRWQRHLLALKSLTIADILAEVDELIAGEPDAQQHPLYALAAHALDGRVMPGTAEGLMARCRCLVDHAVERLIEQRLADPTAWED